MSKEKAREKLEGLGVWLVWMTFIAASVTLASILHIVSVLEEWWEERHRKVLAKPAAKRPPEFWVLF